MPFIVLEGLDGAGKSTQIEMLRQLLLSKGGQCEYMHFPRFNTPVYGELIARFLRGELGPVDQVHPYLVALIFAGDRADAGAMIDGWLDGGKSVILDRYVYSNVGFQCAKLNSIQEQDELRDWILDTEFEQFGIPRPDISIFLDVPLSFTEKKLAEQREGNDRDYLNGKKDIHEQSMDLQRKVREIYLRCAERDNRLKIVNCSLESGEMASPAVIFGRITDLLEKESIIK